MKMWNGHTVEYNSGINKKINHKICRKINGTRKKYLEWGRPDSKRQRSHGLSLLWSQLQPSDISVAITPQQWSFSLKHIEHLQQVPFYSIYSSLQDIHVYILYTHVYMYVYVYTISTSTMKRSMWSNKTSPSEYICITIPTSTSQGPRQKVGAKKVFKTQNIRESAMK